MAGNIMYIPYTAFIIMIIISFSIIVRKKKGSGPTKKFLMIAIPVFMFIQFYFWNLDVNNYLKSYLFPSVSYECEYEEELKNISISLPKRTVLKGRQDYCSPIYLTYVNKEEFKVFYKYELKKLKNQGEIESYHYREDKNGFSIELSSGSKIEIFIYQHKGTNEWAFLIEYHPLK